MAILTLITALIGLILAVNMWRAGHLKGIYWATKYMINDEDDSLIAQYTAEQIPEEIRARLAHLRTGAQKKPTSVKDETMAEIAKIQGANNGNAKEREQQSD